MIWGGLHGIYLTVERLLAISRDRFFPDLIHRKPGALVLTLKQVMTFHLVLLAWVFFRADNLGTAVIILQKVFAHHGDLFWDPIIPQALIAIGILIGLDYFNRRGDYWANLDRYHFGFQTAYAMFLLFAIILFGVDRGAQFIYFQF